MANQLSGERPSPFDKRNDISGEILLPPFNPRYLLILIPMFSLLSVSAIWRLKKPNIRYAIFGGLVFLTLFHSVFLAIEIRNTPAPPVQLINHINQNYGPEDSIVLGGFAEKYFIYYPTSITKLSSMKTDCETIQSLLLGGRVLTLSGSGECDNLKLIGVATFKRDSRVHIKRSTTNLYEFVPGGA